MVKKIAKVFLVFALLIAVGAAAFAVIVGLEENKQSLVKTGESITVPLGAEYESVVAVNGTITVYGHVIKDVVAVGGSVYLKDPALVEGDVVAVGGAVVRESGAIARGNVVEISLPGVSELSAFVASGGMLKGLAYIWALSFVGFIVLAIIMVAVFTPQLGRISSVIEKNLFANFLIGAVILLLFLPIIFVLMISIIGIVLIPVWVILVAAAWFFGYFAVSQLIGKKVLHTFKVYGRSMMTETVVGVVLLALVGAVPIGGSLIKMIAVLCGLGGVYQTRFGSRL